MLRATRGACILRGAFSCQKSAPSHPFAPGLLPMVRKADEQAPGRGGALSTLPETSMMSESAPARTSSFHGLLPNTSLATAQRRESDDETRCMHLVAGQAREIISRGQGGYTILSRSQWSPYKPVLAANECYMGPVQSQTLQSLPVDTGRRLAELVGDQDKQGAILNVGAHIYSADWCPSRTSDPQYLCLSVSLEKQPRTLIGEKVQHASTPARLQVWSMDAACEPKLELVLCFDQGRMSSVRWLPISVPLDEDDLQLGLLSACMQDGTVGVYAVPRPTNVAREQDDGPPHLRLTPLVVLDVCKGVPTAMDWLNADKLAVAYSDGWVAVWSTTACLAAGSRRARPLVFSRLSSSSISSVCWDTSGRQLFVSAYDGSARCMQLALPDLPTILHHSRDVCYAVAYSDVIGLPLMEGPELDDVRAIDFADDKMRSATMYSHLGRIRTLALSPHHPFLASGSTDGSVRVVNVALMQKKRARKVLKADVVFTVFRLDCNRGKGSLRMIENLAPQPPSYQGQHASASTVAWDPLVSLTALRWNPNRGRECWLASTTACGLARIDVVSNG